MTNDRAEQVANVLLTVAAAGAVYYIARTPPLRRLAWRLGVQHAWSETGHRGI
jgi:hypothetical protein